MDGIHSSDVVHQLEALVACHNEFVTAEAAGGMGEEFGEASVK
jgi:hypothetical protein